MEMTKNTIAIQQFCYKGFISQRFEDLNSLEGGFGFKILSRKIRGKVNQHTINIAIKDLGDIINSFIKNVTLTRYKEFN